MLSSPDRNLGYGFGVVKRVKKFLWQRVRHPLSQGVFSVIETTVFRTGSQHGIIS